MELARTLIRLSKSDLESSRVLYDNRQFRTSYFFFQQSAEKANKAFGLLSEIISEDDIFKNKIQHNQTKIYRKGLVEQEEKANRLLNAVKPFPRLENHKFFQEIDFAEYQKYLKDSLSKIDSLYHLDLVRISSSDLNYFLRELRKLEKAKTQIKLPKKADREMKQVMLNVADWIGNVGTQEAVDGKKELEEFLNDEKKWTEFSSILRKKIFPVQLDVIFVNATLWICAIITVQHSSLTRYPDNRNNNPIDIYKKKLPLVKKQPQFMDFLEKALIKLQYLAKLKN